MASLRLDNTRKAVKTWDEAVPVDLNDRARAVMDAALEICIMGMWIGFKLLELSASHC